MKHGQEKEGEDNEDYDSGMMTTYHDTAVVMRGANCLQVLVVHQHGDPASWGKLPQGQQESGFIPALPCGGIPSVTAGKPPEVLRFTALGPSPHGIPFLLATARAAVGGGFDSSSCCHLGDSVRRLVGQDRGTAGRRTEVHLRRSEGKKKELPTS